MLNEDAGKDDILWLASTGVSEILDEQKVNRSVFSMYQFDRDKFQKHPVREQSNAIRYLTG